MVLETPYQPTRLTFSSQSRGNPDSVATALERNATLLRGEDEIEDERNFISKEKADNLLVDVDMAQVEAEKDYCPSGDDKDSVEDQDIAELEEAAEEEFADCLNKDMSGARGPQEVRRLLTSLIPLIKGEEKDPTGGGEVGGTEGAPAAGAGDGLDGNRLVDAVQEPAAPPPSKPSRLLQEIKANLPDGPKWQINTSLGDDLRSLRREARAQRAPNYQSGREEAPNAESMTSPTFNFRSDSSNKLHACAGNLQTNTFTGQQCLRWYGSRI